MTPEGRRAKAPLALSPELREALRRMTTSYMDYMHLNAAAHTWPVD